MSTVIQLKRSFFEYNDHCPLPETVTLYHSTPIENIESIQANGITLTKFDLSGALEAIDKTNAPKWRKDSAKSRLVEAFRDSPSGIVCLSGDKDYSIQNGSACREWTGMLKKDQDYHGKVAVFKIVLPMRILEVLTAPNWKTILDKFKELWCKGYFKRIAWYMKVKGWDVDTGINRYDFWPMTHVPPEYIDSYEIVNQDDYGWRAKVKKQ